MESTELTTKADLESLKSEIVEEIKKITASTSAPKKWLRTREVQDFLGLSSSAIQNLRITGILPYSKIGGTIYFRSDDIEKILNKNLKEGEHHV